jgi:hypothetical protein
MNIKKESLYMIEGHDLSVISRVLTAINSMSGQRLAGKGSGLRGYRTRSATTSPFFHTHDS